MGGVMIPVFLGGEQVGEIPRPKNIAAWYEYALDYGPMWAADPSPYEVRRGFISRVRFRGNGGIQTDEYPQRLINPEIVEYGEKGEDGFHDILHKPATIEHISMIPSFVPIVGVRDIHVMGGMMAKAFSSYFYAMAWRWNNDVTLAVDSDGPLVPLLGRRAPERVVPPFPLTAYLAMIASPNAAVQPKTVD